MKRLPRTELHEGQVMAEALLDKDNQVLLEANTVLTARHLELLEAWHVEFIRIREPGDTDASLAAALAAERGAERRPQPPSNLELLGISARAVETLLAGGLEAGPAGAQTLFRSAAMRQYDDFLAALAPCLVNVRGQEMTLKQLNETAVLILRYLLSTPGVVGYAMRPSTRPVVELARHTLAVSIWAGKIAQLLRFSAREMSNVVYGAVLHDVGKTLLPEAVAFPTKKLTPEEDAQYRSHVALGVSLLKDKTWMPKDVLLILAQHHERLDGSGFPMQTRGEKIQLLARIVALADAIDRALHPTHGAALTLPELAERLPFWQAKHDPALCFLVKQYLEDFICSNRITLNDGRQGEIIFRHHAFREPVIRTEDGEVIDLNRQAEVRVEQYRL